MKTVCIIGNEDGSVREAILKVLATNAPTTFAQTAFKDCETGEEFERGITIKNPLEVLCDNIVRDANIKLTEYGQEYQSGRESRRARRKKERKSKKR